MRLFIALELSDPVRQHLAKMQDALRSCAAGRWTAAANLHITLKFLGEVPDDRVPALCDALAAVPLDDILEMQVDRLEIFPPHGPIRVIGAGLSDAEGRCAALQADIESRCCDIGYLREGRRFIPHITLARVEKRTPAETRVRLTVAAEGQLPGPKFECEQFVLMESQLTNKGSIYNVAARFPR